MSGKVSAVLYVAVMVAVIVVDGMAVFGHHVGPRLAVNLGMVFVFVAFYLRFIGRPWAPHPDPREHLT
jgi:hypothetical protein